MLGMYLVMLETDAQRSRFEELYMTYRSTLYNYAYQILRDIQLSEDAVSETFLILARRMQVVEKMSETEIRNYLIVVVKNAAKKIYAKRSNQVILDELDMVQPLVADAEEEVAMRLENKRIFAMLQSMDEQYIDIFYLKYYMGLTEREIAESLDLKLSTVKARIARGKQQLREIMEREEQYDTEPI